MDRRLNDVFKRKPVLTIRFLLPIVFFVNVIVSHAAEIERNYPQSEIPVYWKSTVDDVEAAVTAIEHGKTKTIALSPGGRPVYLVTYGPKVDIQSQANYNSAVAARDMVYYARKKKTALPIVYLIGAPHRRTSRT